MQLANFLTALAEMRATHVQDNIIKLQGCDLRDAEPAATSKADYHQITLRVCQSL
jgi:hypothetical protein